MTTYRFQEVSYRAARSLKCACGKRFRRSRTFTHTVNPFNRNEHGNIKTYREVWEDVRAEGAAWWPDPVCSACEEADRA